MTIHAVEKALWLLGNEQGHAERFRADPDAYLDEFRLDPDEREIVRNVDVRRLSDRGVNPLLLLGVQRAVKGGDSIPDYMRQMNTPAA